MKNIFIGVICLVCLIVGGGKGFANNLDVANVTLTDQDTGSDTYDIEFDLSMDNSWRIAGAPSLTANWDAAWVFAKFSTFSGGVWSDWAHCTLLNTGSVVAVGSTMSFADNESDGVYRGAFVYRSASGSGSVDWDDNQIRWDYGTDGVGDSDVIHVKVFGIEMVYIPQGDFELGDTDCDNDGNIEHNAGCSGAVSIGTTITAALCTDGNSFDSGIECADGDSTGTFCIDGDGGFDLGCDGIDNADFPTGYEAFYMMKYEVTQKQYVDFLNMLTRDQQNTRTASQTADQYVMSNSNNVDYRSGIRAPSSIPTGVIKFGCDLDGITAHNTSTGDGTFNESDDGQWVAANYLSYMDGAAYADWAALRPFTGLEFEKAARGGQTAVDDEYVWGNTTLESATSSLTNSGEASEVGNQGNMNYPSASPDGPFRVGSYADATSTRTNSGGSYYGVMDLSGNLWERPVSIGIAAGRTFTGTHGDGELTTTTSYEGNATNTDWPGINGTASYGVTDVTGVGFRGGAFDYSSTNTRVADRSYASQMYAPRYSSHGARCVRTSP